MVPTRMDNRLPIKTNTNLVIEANGTAAAAGGCNISPVKVRRPGPLGWRVHPLHPTLALMIAMATSEPIDTTVMVTRADNNFLTTSTLASAPISLHQRMIGRVRVHTSAPASTPTPTPAGEMIPLGIKQVRMNNPPTPTSTAWTMTAERLTPSPASAPSAADVKHVIWMRSEAGTRARGVIATATTAPGRSTTAARRGAIFAGTNTSAAVVIALAVNMMHTFIASAAATADRRGPRLDNRTLEIMLIVNRCASAAPRGYGARLRGRARLALGVLIGFAPHPTSSTTVA